MRMISELILYVMREERQLQVHAWEQLTRRGTRMPFSASLGQSHRCASTLLSQAFQRPLNKDPNNPRKMPGVISRPAVRATLFAMVSKTPWRDDVLARAGAFRLLVGVLYIRLSSSAACSASLAACSARSFSFS